MRRIALSIAALAASCGGGGGGGGGSRLSVVATDPPEGATEVPLDAAVRFRTSAPLDPASLAPDAFVVRDPAGNPVGGSFALDADGTTLRFEPASPLLPDQTYTAVLAAGVASSGGAALGAPFEASFETTDDATPPEAMLAPIDGATAIPTNARIVAVFSEPIAPASVSPIALHLAGPGGPAAGALSASKGDRVLTFVPAVPLPPNASFTVTLDGGPKGPHDLAGNALAADVIATFQTGSGPDFVPPTISVTVNAIPSSMNAGLRLPPHGFTIDATFADDRAVNPGSFAPTASVPLGPEGLPTAAAGEDLFPLFSIAPASASALVAERHAFPASAVTVTAGIEDLAGNAAVAGTLETTSDEFPDPLRPFEDGQRVFVDFEADRGPVPGGNGAPDFDEDLLAYGLLAPGDPAATNATMRAACLARVLEVASSLLEAAPGARIELHATPPSSPFTSIALGGIDLGDPGRAIGDPSTGIVGRAWFDAHNADLSDDDTVTNPPLGVFPGEMFIALGNTALAQGNPGLTLFGQTFAPTAPAFGGTPAGAHPLDPIVLAPGFDPLTATPAQMVRHLGIVQAVDRFGRSIGTVLAHELAHSFGLVETGLPPTGLHGTGTKHNQFASPLDVMVAAFSWDNLVILPIRFRPLNLAYLRERVVVE